MDLEAAQIAEYQAIPRETRERIADALITSLTNTGRPSFQEWRDLLNDGMPVTLFELLLALGVVRRTDRARA
jgi:hypothetical protein